MASTTNWLIRGQCAILAFFLIMGLVMPWKTSAYMSSNLPMDVHMKDDPDLSEFLSLLERDATAMMRVLRNAVTVFAPTNRAFQSYVNNKTYLNYHMLSAPLHLLELNDVVPSLHNDTPLYITKKMYKDDRVPPDFYINNAFVLLDRSDLEFRSMNGHKQILHVIDEVITPIMTMFDKTLDPPNPDAWQFLQNVESINIDQHRVRSFRKKVNQYKKDELFKRPGASTFFIPVEEGIKLPPYPTMHMLDRKVIEGHVIPGKAIFITPGPYDHPMETVAFEDELRITISLVRFETGKNARVSNTMYGHSRYKPGAVIAEIVKANIPVANGVVHLIHRPLVVVDMHGIQLLTDYGFTLWTKFRELIEDYAPDFLNVLRTTPLQTIFIPRDEAVVQMMQTNFMSDRKKLHEVLMMHVVPDAITTDRIKSSNIVQIYQIPTLDPRRLIYFNMNENRTTRKKVVTVEGGGVNASLILSDIATMDGYIHIIDRMLGVSFTTVQEKLETDPMLNLTYHFGKLNNFNNQLSQTTRRFTYFVPRDKAWIQWFAEHPNANLENFVRNRDQTRNVLERHLIVADRVFRMAQLRNMSYDSLFLPTVGPDTLKIKVKEEDNRFFIQWKGTGKWTTVFRADVECTNGLIHVIDVPFMHEYEVSSNISGGTDTQLQHFTASALILVLTGISTFAPFWAM